MKLSDKPEGPDAIGLDTYLGLYAPYEDQLAEFTANEREYGGRFALLFRRVVTMLVMPAGINERVPKLFVEVAQRYMARDPEAVHHFSYEENRHFFLSDLREWLEIHDRGRRLRQTEDA